MLHDSHRVGDAALAVRPIGAQVRDLAGIAPRRFDGFATDNVLFRLDGDPAARFSLACPAPRQPIAPARVSRLASSLS